MRYDCSGAKETGHFQVIQRTTGLDSISIRYHNVPTLCNEHNYCKIV